MSISTKKKRVVMCLALVMGVSSHAAKPLIEERGLTKAVTHPDQPSKEWQMYQRIQTLDAELTKLRDKVERMEVQAARDKKAFETRVTILEQTLDRQIDLTADRLSGANANKADDNKQSQNKQSENKQPQNKPSASRPTTPPSKSTQSNSSKSEAGKTSSAPANEAAARKDYLAAYNAYKQKGAKAGIAGMDAFIKNHSTSVLVPSAHYWAGEFYLSGKKPDMTSAELRFATVVKRYPKDKKASRALYRLASLADADNKQSTARRYMQKLLDKYPNSKEVSLAKAYLKRNN